MGKWKYQRTAAMGILSRRGELEWNQLRNKKFFGVFILACLHRKSSIVGILSERAGWLRETALYVIRTAGMGLVTPPLFE
jgi:hypothetical protein